MTKQYYLSLFFAIVAAYCAAQPAQAFMLQNAYNLQRGEAYFQNGDLLYNHVTVGLDDHFSVGAGIMPTFLLDAGYLNYTLSAKMTMPLIENKLNVGVGIFHWADTYIEAFKDDWYNHVTANYGMITYGSRYRNFSIALGGAFTDNYTDGAYLGNGVYIPDRSEFDPSPYVGFSAISKGKKKWAFVTENHLFWRSSNQLIILSDGVKYIGRGVTWDFGFAFTIDRYFYFSEPFNGGENVGKKMYESDIYPIPWLGLCLPIGKKSRQIWHDAHMINP